MVVVCGCSADISTRRAKYDKEHAQMKTKRWLSGDAVNAFVFASIFIFIVIKRPPTAVANYPYNIAKSIKRKIAAVNRPIKLEALHQIVSHNWSSSLCTNKLFH